MTFKVMCPKTNKIETIYCTTIHCPTFDNPNNRIIGLIYACSAIKIQEDTCEDCPKLIQKK